MSRLIAVLRAELTYIESCFRCILQRTAGSHLSMGGVEESASPFQFGQL